MSLAFEDILAAQARLKGHIERTPCRHSRTLSEITGAEVWVKFENLQFTAAYKERGALNKLLQLGENVRSRGVIAASAGNHSQGLAYHAARLGIPVTIVMPKATPFVKVQQTRAHGAEVVIEGDGYDEASAMARKLCEERELTFVHPFDDADVMAGQGTVALEMLEDVPDLEVLPIPIGGGGLIAGMAAAIKQLRPQTRIVGVEPTGAASMRYAVEAGHVLPLPEVRTIADTLAPRAVCERTLALTQQYVDQIVTVSDAHMVTAMRWLWAECNQLVEPAGAAVIAALQSNVVDVGVYTHPVALICGGNAAVENAFAAYAV